MKKNNHNTNAVRSILSGALKRKWITLVSRSDKHYGVGIHLTTLLKHGRPLDFKGKPMVAKKPEIEKILKEAKIK